MHALDQLPALLGLFSVAATVLSGPRRFRPKRRNEAIRMTDRRAQSPSLAITLGATFGRAMPRRLRFGADVNESLRSNL